LHPDESQNCKNQSCSSNYMPSNAAKELERMRMELREKDNIIEEMNEQIKKLQDVLIEYAKTDGDASIVQDPDDPNNQLILKSTAKQGVTAASNLDRCEEKAKIKMFPKTDTEKKFIRSALSGNLFLKALTLRQLDLLADYMQQEYFTENKAIINEGELGTCMYVLADGQLEVRKDHRILKVIKEGEVFGELAILYHCKRTATIMTREKCRIWSLSRTTFQHIIKTSGKQEIDKRLAYLSTVDKLKFLTTRNLHKIVDLLEEEVFEENDYIIHQGTHGDTFYIISKGHVEIKKHDEATGEDIVLREMGEGSYFGEMALLSEDDLRTASVICKTRTHCYTLDRDPFIRLIGSVVEKDWNNPDEEESEEESTSGIVPLTQYSIDDMELITTIGIGAFGRVELVRPIGDETRSFALKKMAKFRIVEQDQQEHIKNEKNLLMTLNNDFIVKCYQSFRDRQFVYLLLDACLGGEVWTMIQNQGPFNERQSHFVIGCVIEAIDYLHSWGIVYRDLKPENLMTDDQGYVKLVDFGFAKKIGHRNKTWTFCGTPEYVCPEILLNTGHDLTADLWALGCLIFELLSGKPPFSCKTGNQIEIYKNILGGIDALIFPERIQRTPRHVIKKLCRANPRDRLGAGKEGLEEIGKQKWLGALNWNALRGRTLISPIRQPYNGPSDARNFDMFSPEMTDTIDETSGWDLDF